MESFSAISYDFCSGFRNRDIPQMFLAGFSGAAKLPELRDTSEQFRLQAAMCIERAKVQSDDALRAAWLEAAERAAQEPSSGANRNAAGRYGHGLSIGDAEPSETEQQLSTTCIIGLRPLTT
jgi:hypothetical protein